MSDITSDLGNKKARLGRGLGSLLGSPGGGVDLPKMADNSTSLDSQKQGLTTQETRRLASADIQQPQSQPQAHAQVAATTQQPAVPPESRIWKVAIDKLMSGKYQPRTSFEKEKLEELSASIKTNGIVQPIVARKTSTGKFEIIAGERRWRAAQLAGLHEVPVILKELQNQSALEIAIIENIQREDLNPVEEGRAYQRLAEEFALTQQQIADKVGKDRATVANLMRILQLPPSIRELISQNLLSLGHAKVLLGLKDMTKAQQLAEKIISEAVSVRSAEKLVAQANIDKPKETQTAEVDLKAKLISGIAEDLQKRLGTKIQIEYNHGKGKVAIQFYSDDEFNQLIDRLKK